MAERKTRNRRPSRKWMLLFAASPVLLLLLFVVVCNLWVTWSSGQRIHKTVDTLPQNAVGLVLGTSKKIGPDRPNLHFRYRMQAAADLYLRGKVQHLIVSGSHDSAYYNEPEDMTKALLELGVPLSAITKDESGFRTLDSVVRASKVFGQDRFTVITDDFHIARAVFLARQYDLDVVGYPSQKVEATVSATSRVREVFARVKAVLDICVLGTQPREIGQPVPIRLVSRN